MPVSSRTPQSVALLLICASASPFAKAQVVSPCNGDLFEEMVGVAGPLGTPMCVHEETKDEAMERREGTRRANEKAYSEAEDRKNATIVKMTEDLNRRTADTLEKRKRLENDPTFKKMNDGFWFYIEPGRNGAPKTIPCTAKFVQTRGMVALVAVGGPDAPIGITLEGSDIPKPSTDQEIEVTLSQDSMPAVVVKMSNFFVPGNIFGTLAFTSGTNLKAVMVEMKDEAGELKVDFKGTTIFEGRYARVSEMKKRFSSCVNQVKD